MKRTFFGLIVIVIVVCFFSLAPSTAADEPKCVFGDERLGVDDGTRAPNVRTTTGGLNYVREVYTAIAPSAGETYNKSAENVFSIYETIYLYDRYYVGTPGTYTRYRFIKDVVGCMVTWSAKTYTINAPGYYWSEKTIYFTAVGSYVYHLLTTGPGDWLSSQQFPFIVE